MCDYGWWLVRWGLTPDRVDALPAGFAVRFPDYVDVWDQVMNERRQQG